VILAKAINLDEKRILIIDDNTQIHQDFKKVLLTSKDEESDLGELEEALLEKEEEHKLEKYTIDCASQGEEGLKKVEESIKNKEPYAVAFIDVRMPPGLDGIETISRIWDIYPELQIVICTAYSDYSWQDLFDKFGNTDKLLILKKPFDNVEVRQLAYTLSKKWELNKIANLKINELEEIVQDRTRELQHSEEKYRTMIENSNDMIWMLNTKGEFTYFNKRSAENHYEVRIHDVTGEKDITLSVNTTSIFKNGKVTGTVSFGRDITKQKAIENELKRTNIQLQALARTDFLTKLPNRRSILEKIEYEINKFERSREPFIIMIGDLNKFKFINDAYGHSIGDKVLELVSRVMSSNLRKQDIVARWGGDEFLLLLPQTNLEGGKVIIMKLEKEIAKSFINFQKKKIYITITFGLSIYDKIMNIDQCIKTADIDLYNNKKKYKIME
jgi:diguanylate cyclase (GGDEF)-like protein